ncbi:CDP-glycerol glycerophosphotransferase family protein [Nitrosopumilus sp. S4]
MFSKVFCYYEKEDLVALKNILIDEKEQFEIICDNALAKKELKNKVHSIKILEEYFSVYSDEMFDIYEQTKKSLLEYQKLCKDIKFNGYSINEGLIHYLQIDILFIEKIRKILENKKNIIFIFERIHFRDFIIQKIAKGLGYNNDESIFLIKNNKIKKYEIKDSIQDFEKSNKINKYKNAFSLYSNNIIKNQEKKTFPKFNLFLKSISLLTKFLINKTYEISPEKSSQLILKNIQKKIIKANSIKCGFFLSSSRSDLLDAQDKIFKKFLDSKIPFRIFTIDSITSSFLDEKQYPVSDYFQETFALANILRKTNESKRFEEKLLNAVKSEYSIIYNQKWNSELIDGIYRSIASQMVLDSIFKSIKLQNAIFIEGTLIGMLTAELSKKYDFSTTSIETLIIDKNAISSILFKADKICIYGTQGLETLLGYGINKNRIELTGNPKYDYMKDYDTDKSKKMLEKKYKISNNSKVILIAMSRWHEKDELWISDLIKFVNANSFEIVIKLHPRYKSQSDGIHEKIKYIKNKCQNKKYYIIYDFDLNLLMSSADIIISDYSNVGVEGILLGKPVINVNFSRENLKNAQNYHKSGSALYTENYNELEKMIIDIFVGKKYVKELQDNQKIMIDKYNYYNDGMASERIFKLISSN